MKKIEQMILIFCILLAVILTIVKIGVSTFITTGGTQYSNIEDKTKILETENIILKEKILNTSALFMIASEAASMGFDYPKNDQRLAITNIAPFAYKQ